MTKKTLTVREKLMRYLNKRKKWLPAKELSEKLQLNYNTVRKELGKLLRERHIMSSKMTKKVSIYGT